MFFGRKEKLTDQQAVFREREEPRYSLKAGITIEGFEGEGLMENISISGCCMESTTYAAILPDEVYNVTINPGPNDNIKPFTKKIKAAWTKCSEDIFQAGFLLEDKQSNIQFKQYVELLDSSGVVPDYWNKRR